MGRRGIKEYRPAEALALIVADRDHKAVACPSCGGEKIKRVPPRGAQEPDTPGPVTLTCGGCGRKANYLVPGYESSTGPTPTPEL